MEQTTNRCNFCGYSNKSEAKICSLCKKPLLTRMEAARQEIVNSIGSRQKVCVKCGKKHDVSSVFCSKCQSELVFHQDGKEGQCSSNGHNIPDSNKKLNRNNPSLRKGQGKALSVFSNIASLTAGIFVGLTLARFL